TIVLWDGGGRLVGYPACERLQAQASTATSGARRNARRRVTYIVRCVASMAHAKPLRQRPGARLQEPAGAQESFEARPGHVVKVVARPLYRRHVVGPAEVRGVPERRVDPELVAQAVLTEERGIGAHIREGPVPQRAVAPEHGRILDRADAALERHESPAR